MSVQPGMRAFVTVARDVVSYCLGWALMDSQVGIFRAPPAHPSETAMWIAALLIGVPGIAQVIALRFGTAPGGSPPAVAGSPASLSSSPSEGPVVEP